MLLEEMKGHRNRQTTANTVISQEYQYSITEVKVKYGEVKCGENKYGEHY